MDINFLSYAHERPLGGKKLDELIPEAGMSDTLKVTDSADGVIFVNRVVGGKEDCLDVNNHAENIIIGTPDTVWEPKGKFAWTVKGGSRKITINGVLKGHGKEVDLDLGNWSDQSSKPTTQIVLNVRSYDGSPITYRVLNADKPRFLVGVKVKNKFTLPKALRGLFLYVFSLLKRLGVA